jgi:hypothetical protein
MNNHLNANAAAQWVSEVSALVDLVAQWAREENWSVHRFEQEHHESGLGTYAVPHLRVSTPFGEIQVEPVVRNVQGADGRVDVRSWPSLNRVRLVRKGGVWEVITDSNVPLGVPWSKAAFVRLAEDLQAAA